MTRLAAVVLLAAAIPPAVSRGAAPALTATASGAAAVEEILARVQAAEDSAKDVSLAFRQTMYLKATGDAQTTKGTLALLRSPERFRVTFTAPARQEALYDGTFLWLYLPEAGQAFRQKAGPDELARVLGLNPAEPVRSFRRGYRASLAGYNASGCAIDFARVGDPPMTWHIRVSATTWRMEEAWFENDEVKISLSCYDYRVNSKLGVRDFRMVLPRDVEVQDGLPMLFGRGGP